MYERRADTNLVSVQSAFDRFINAPPNDRQDAFADFGGAIFEHFSHRVESDPGRSLFSLDVPDRIQRFAAAWLLRAINPFRHSLEFWRYRTPNPLCCLTELCSKMFTRI